MGSGAWRTQAFIFVGGLKITKLAQTARNKMSTAEIQVWLPERNLLTGISVNKQPTAICIHTCAQMPRTDTPTYRCTLTHHKARTHARTHACSHLSAHVHSSDYWKILIKMSLRQEARSRRWSRVDEAAAWSWLEFDRALLFLQWLVAGNCVPTLFLCISTFPSTSLLHQVLSSWLITNRNPSFSSSSSYAIASLTVCQAKWLNCAHSTQAMI